MRLKLDENLPREAAEPLRRAGHDVATVLQQDLGGTDDRQLIEVCRQEARVLVTLDTDFADIRAYPPAEAPGLLVLRLRQQDKAYVVETLERLIPLLKKETPNGQLWIVEDDRIRIRDV